MRFVCLLLTFLAAPALTAAAQTSGTLSGRALDASAAVVQSSYTWSDSEDTTQASTFFSDATNGTTSAFPEFIPDYNRGPSDFNVEHNLVANATWDIPWGRGLSGTAAAMLSGWRVSAIGTYRSGYPLTVFVQNNRSRSQWQPSLGPGIGRDRPSYAPGFSAGNAVRDTISSGKGAPVCRG